MRSTYRLPLTLYPPNPFSLPLQVKEVRVRQVEAALESYLSESSLWEAERQAALARRQQQEARHREDVANRQGLKHDRMRYGRTVESQPFLGKQNV